MPWAPSSSSSARELRCLEAAAPPLSRHGLELCRLHAALPFPVRRPSCPDPRTLPAGSRRPAKSLSRRTPCIALLPRLHRLKPSHPCFLCFVDEPRARVDRLQPDRPRPGHLLRLLGHQEPLQPGLLRPPSTTGPTWPSASVSFRSCEDLFDYVRLSSSWTRSSSLWDFSFRCRRWYRAGDATELKEELDEDRVRCVVSFQLTSSGAQLGSIGDLCSIWGSLLLFWFRSWTLCVPG